MSDSVFKTDGNGTITGLVVGTSYPGELIIPEYVAEERITSIGENAFRNYTNLTSVTIPNSVTSIGNNAFYYCTSLISITIPNSVTSIGDNAFYYCPNLLTITIPNSVTSIGSYAFYYCENLMSVTIPNSVTSIGSDAFSECINLTTIYVDDPNNLSNAVSSYNWDYHVGPSSGGVTFVKNPVVKVKNLVINKLTLDQYRAAKSDDNVADDEVYVITDIDNLRPSMTKITLTASNWSDNTQNITVNGIVADETAQAITVSPYGKINTDLASDAGIYCSAQGANSLTFICETTPTSDVEFVVEWKTVSYV